MPDKYGINKTQKSSVNSNGAFFNYKNIYIFLSLILY